MLRRFGILTVLALSIAACAVGVTNAAETTTVEKNAQSVVSVGVVLPQDYTQQGTLVGSGVVIGDGYVVTDFNTIAWLYVNKTALEQAGIPFETYVFDGESNRPYDIIAASQQSSLALLRVRGLARTPVEWGDSEKVKQGDQVYLVGFPLGLKKVTVQPGSVTQPKQQQGPRTYIQTDAGMAPGSEGGALLDANGKFIGVASVKMSGEKVDAIGFAIPSGDVKGFLQDSSPPELKKQLEKAWNPVVVVPPVATETVTPKTPIKPEVTKTVDYTPWIIGGVIGFFVLILLIVLAVVLMRKGKAPAAAPAPAPAPMPQPGYAPQAPPQAPGTMAAGPAATMMSSPAATVISGNTVALTVKTGGGERSVTVTLPAVVGRAPDAGVHLDDAEVSRRHCEISRVNGELTVRDLGSRNGTRLNGGTVGSAPLKSGDRIQVGASEIIIP